MEQLDFYSSKVLELYEYLETSVFEIVSKTLAKQLATSGELSLAEWQIRALADTGQLTQETLKLIAEVLGLTEEAVREAVYAAGFDTTKNVDKYLSHRETPPQSAMLESLEALVQQAHFNLENLVNETMISRNVVGQIYRDIINAAVAEVTAGVNTLEGAVSKAVNAWVDKGVPSSFYDKRGYSWSVENYVKTTIRTTVNNTFNTMSHRRMADYGIYTVRVGSHPAARLACSKIQGHVVDLRPVDELPPGWKFKSIYDPSWEADYLEPHGHRGINCSHYHIPFDPDFDEDHGVTEGTVSPEEAVRAGEVEAQRKRIANRIRKTKKKIIAFEALGDKDKLAHNKKLLNKQRRTMVQYVKDHDLKREYVLEKVTLPDEEVIAQVKSGLKKA